MTIREAIMEGAALIGARGSESPFLDASLLLSLSLSVSKSALLSRYPEALPEKYGAAYRSLLARRAAGEPLAYISGIKKIRDLEFAVDPRVLIPRPETEHLVEAALKAAAALAGGTPGAGAKALAAHDCCAGSGCVGISLAKELPDAVPGARFALSLSDISAQALEVASRNAERLLGAALPAYRSDLLADVPGRGFSLIVSNPPYLTQAETAEVRARAQGEPELALYGGPDGLDMYRRLAPQAMERLAPGGFLIMEIGRGQGAAVSALLSKAGFAEVFVERDLAGLDRVAGGRKHG